MQKFLVCPCFLVVHPCTLQVLPIFYRLWSHSAKGTRSLHGSGCLLLPWTRPSGLHLHSAAPEPRLLCSALPYPLALSTIPADCQDQHELGARRGQLRAWPIGWPPLFVCLIQFSSVQSLSRARLCNPMNCSTPGLPVHHQPLEFTQIHIHRVSDAIQPSHPLSSPSPPAPSPSQHQSLFQ